MNIETLIQSFKLGEKQAITQALCELIDFLAQGPKAQEDVIQFLPENNLLMVLDFLSDPDTYIRKLTTKFLLDLVHDNYLVQLVFCDILGLIPTDGKICLNSVPDPFKHVAKYVPECLETLKQSAAEEKEEQLPYCWYLHVQNADKQDKKITFISVNDKDSVLEMDELFDPFYAVVGFIMRCPRKENTSKVFKSKLSEIVRPIVTQMSVDLTNMSLDQSLQQRTVPDQPRTNVSINGENMSVKRKPLAKNGIVGLPHISSRAPGKPNMNLTMLTPTNSQLKTDKDQQQNKTILVVSDNNTEEPASATSDKKIVTRVVFKKMPSDDRKTGSRKTEPTIDPIEVQQGSKLNASVTDTHEMEMKMTTLENSLNNSLVIKGKSTVATPSASSATTKIKAQATPKTAKNPKTEKTLTHREKELSSILTTDEVSLSQHGKQKSTDLDKKVPLKTPKGSVYTIPNSGSRTVPNTTLLNKILKAKPVPAKEKTHVMSQSIQHGKHEQKGSFWDFIYAYRKINATTLSSVISTTNKSAKTSTVNTAKKQEQQEPKSSSTTQMRKRTIHSSLIQGNMEPNSSVSNRYEALDDELSLDMTPKETSLSSRKNTQPLKTYHVSQSFKNPVSSSRASQELKKESVTTFGKFMSPRKSSDVTYLTNHKKKVDTSAVAQDTKNKKTQQKKVNQTLTHEPVHVK